MGIYICLFIQRLFFQTEKAFGKQDETVLEVVLISIN